MLPSAPARHVSIWKQTTAAEGQGPMPAGFGGGGAEGEPLLLKELGTISASTSFRASP